MEYIKDYTEQHSDWEAREEYYERVLSAFDDSDDSDDDDNDEEEE